MTTENAVAAHRATCTCGGAIVWATTPKGEAMPVNAESYYRGNVLLSETDGVLYAGVLGRNQADGAYERGAVLYMPHWASCPDAAKHRRRDQR